MKTTGFFSPKPLFVGVAGIMTSDEVVRAVDTMPNAPRHKLAIGILTSAKTLAGQPNRYPNRYPKVEDIPGILNDARAALGDKCRNVMFVLHYSIDVVAELDGKYLRLVDKLITSARFDAIQVNASPIVVLDPLFCANLTWLASNYEGFRAIIQLRPPRGKEPWVDLVDVAIHIAQSSKFISDLILDASGGRGTPMDVQGAHALISAIRSAYHTTHNNRHHFTFTVAGGLGPDEFDPVRDLMRVHGPLGFDAERLLRDDSDHLDIVRMQRFLQQAWELVGEEEQVDAR